MPFSPLPWMGQLGREVNWVRMQDGSSTHLLFLHFIEYWLDYGMFMIKEATEPSWFIILDHLEDELASHPWMSILKGHIS